MTYPHRYTAAPDCEHLTCRCDLTRLVYRGNIRHIRHADGSATAEEGDNCPAAMREHIAELSAHAASVHKAVAAERAATVAWLRTRALKAAGAAMRLDDGAAIELAGMCVRLITDIASAIESGRHRGEEP